MKTVNNEIAVYLYENPEKTEYEQLFWESLKDYTSAWGISLLPGTAICRSGRGKPRLVPACGVSFSISHTRGIWACAFSGQDVGLDIEKKRPCDAALIARRFFHPAEAAFILQKPDAFFSVWTAKESYVKYTGTGIDDTFGKFCAVQDEKLCGKIGEAEIRPLRFREEYSMCVCAKNLDSIKIIVK